MEPDRQTNSKDAAASLQRPEAFCTPLSRIVGLHEAITQTIQELALPPFRTPLKQLRTDPGATQWLAAQPVQVLRVRSRLRCVGNVRVFQLMQASLAPEHEICCIDLGDRSDAQVRRGFVAELIYGTALMGTHSKDVAALYKGLLLAEQAGLWSPPGPITKHVARLLQIDPRRLNKVRDRKADDDHAGHESGGSPLVGPQ